MVFSNQSLSSWAVKRSAKTRVHSCFHSSSKLLSLVMTSADPFSIPCSSSSSSSNTIKPQMRYNADN